MYKFFVIVTLKYIWIPLYLLLILLIYLLYSKNKIKHVIIIILGCILVVACTDIISSKIIKPYFMRLRPSHEPLLKDLVHIVNGYKGGLYGFVSSHAANSLGIANYCWIFLHKKYKYIWLLYLWSILVGYSRIYLGVHYPGDIIFGYILGLTISYIVSLIINRIYILRR